MMKVLFAALLAFSGLVASAQSGNTGGCGTMTPQSEVDKIYDFVQHNPAAYAKSTAGAIDSIPLSVHIVGNDAGIGYYTLDVLFPLLCALNERYVPLNFHFYIQWPLEYINNTAYYAHDFAAGDAMMRQYNVPNSVNVYFVRDPAGNCGYYTYGADGVAISKSCAAPASTTLAHELGHFFSLPHTFYGWENNNTPANPEAIRRSGPGANCSSAGDGFCDTYADYISTRWTCPAPVGRTDQFGDLYHVDSSIYMSYSLDGCQSHFSSQEMAAMQYNLHSRRQSYSGAVNPRPRPLDSVRVAYPADTLYANHIKAVWRRIPGADYYYVRLGRQDVPVYVLQSAFTTDTSMDITYAMEDGVKYLLNVAPVNAHDFCMKRPTLQPFTFTTKSSNLNVVTAGGGGRGMQITPYPNPAVGGADLQLDFGALPAGIYTITLSAISGQVLSEQSISYAGSHSAYALKTRGCADGIYFLRWKSANGQGVARLKIGL